MLKPGLKPCDEYRDILMAYCRKNIAKYAMPYEIEFREQLPKTLVGKVAYRVLEEEEINRLNGEKKNEPGGRLLGEVTPQALLAQPQTALQALGLSARKVDYMRGIARQVVDGELDLPGMAALEDAEVCRRLAALRGIGVWTAEMLLLFSLQRPDILSYDDLAIRRGLRMLYRHKEMPRERFERYRRRFSPYGSLASLYLWAIAGGALPELDDPAERKKGRSRPAASLKSTVTKD